MPQTAERKRPAMSGLERLRDNELIQYQLEQLGIGVEAKTAYGGMDLTFVGPEGNLMGISVFGEREVVGLVVEPNQSSLDLRLRRLLGTEVMTDLLSQGPQVVGMTTAKLEKWLKYYDQAKKYLSILGGRVLEQSGLREYKGEDIKRLYESMKVLLSEELNRIYLHENGSEKLIAVDDKKTEFVFADKNKAAVSLVLRNVVTPQMEGAMLCEYTNTQEAIGLVLPKRGEDKIGLYTRAVLLGKKYSKMIGREVVFAVISNSQMKLWEGWGIRPEQSVPGLVSETELLNLLTLGESNLRPGLLTRIDGMGDGQWALLDPKLMPEVITFVGRTGHEGRDIRRLPPVQVFDPRARRKGEFETMPLNGAVAIMRVPEELTFEQMKQIARPIEDRFAHLLNTGSRGEKPRLIFLTPKLMEAWKAGNFWGTTDQVRWLDKIRKREYGFPTSEGRKADKNSGGIYYRSAHSKPDIGGGYRALSGEDSMILLDVGTQFGSSRPEYRRFKDMLVTDLVEGKVPMWPSLLEPEAALHSMKIIEQLAASSDANKNSIVVYLATQIVAGLSEEEIRETLGERIGQIVWEIGNANQGVYGNPKTGIDSDVSHIHVDHTGSALSMAANIKMIMSLASHIMAEARDDLAPLSARTLDAVEWWNSSRGFATPKKRREVVILKDGEVYTTGGVRIEHGGVEHSTIGAVARRFEYEEGLVVVDTGDVRRWGRSPAKGSKTEKTFRRWASQKLDWLIMETTSIRDGADLRTRDWRRRLDREAPVTDEPLFDGARNMFDYPENAGKTIVLFSSPYDLSRNVTLMEAAVASGREVVLGARHAMIAAKYTTEQGLLGPNTIEYEDLDLDVPDSYGLFLTEGAKVYSNNNALQDELKKRGHPIYDRQSILNNGGEKVLLFNPFGNELAALDNLPLEGKLAAGWSSSIMYSQFDIGRFINNKAHYLLKYTDRMWAEPNFWKGRLPIKLVQPKIGKMHRSGHNSPLEILWLLSLLQGKKMNILLHHTDSPTEAANFIKSAFPKEDWNIVGRMSHYDPKVLPTIDKPGVGPMLRLNK